MSLKEEFDADVNDWIDVAKVRWERIPGINNVKVKILRSYEMSDSDGENVILIDKRRSAKRMKRIANVFLMMSIILILLAVFEMLISRSGEIEFMDYIRHILPPLLFILLSLFFLNLSGAPHFRLTRNKDELHIEKWLSHKSDSISYSTKRASLHLYKVDYEESRTRSCIVIMDHHMPWRCSEKRVWH